MDNPFLWNALIVGHLGDINEENQFPDFESDFEDLDNFIRNHYSHRHEEEVEGDKDEEDSIIERNIQNDDKINQKDQTCPQHKKKIEFICFNKLCYQENRYLCPQCCRENSHKNHQNDIFTLEDSLNRLSKDQTCISEAKSQEVKKRANELRKVVWNIQQSIDEFEKDELGAIERQLEEVKINALSSQSQAIIKASSISQAKTLQFFDICKQIEYKKMISSILKAYNTINRRECDISTLVGYQIKQENLIDLGERQFRINLNIISGITKLGDSLIVFGDGNNLHFYDFVERKKKCKLSFHSSSLIDKVITIDQNRVGVITSTRNFFGIQVLEVPLIQFQAFDYAVYIVEYNKATNSTVEKCLYKHIPLSGEVIDAQVIPNSNLMILVIESHILIIFNLITLKVIKKVHSNYFLGLQPIQFNWGIFSCTPLINTTIKGHFYQHLLAVTMENGVYILYNPGNHQIVLRKNFESPLGSSYKFSRVVGKQNKSIVIQGNFKEAYIIEVLTGKLTIKRNHQCPDYYDLFSDSSTIPFYDENSILFYDVANSQHLKTLSLNTKQSYFVNQRISHFNS